MKTKTLGLLILTVVVAVAAGVIVTSRSSSPASTSGSAVETIALAEFAVSDYAGRPVVVNVFGSWCPPCNAEAPDLATFARQNPGAQVVGIAAEDTEEDATEFMQKYGLDYPLVLDDGSLVQEFGIVAFPTTIFFDAQGDEVDRLVGAAVLDQFTASLAKAQ
jgi:thiol-disulfide isomerase/thioredoxin